MIPWVGIKLSEDYTTFASAEKKHCNGFKLSELSANNFKCLVFFQGLVSAKDAKIRRWVLNKSKNEPNVTHQQIAEDCQRFVSECQDSKNIEKSGVAHTRKVHQKKKKQSNSPFNSNQYKKKQNNLPPNPCSGCGSLHWYKDCPYRNKKCLTCSRVGHKSEKNC